MNEAIAPHSSAQNASMIEIPAGIYTIGSMDGAPDQRPQHRLRLARFKIDRTEVTNAAFAEYLNALDLHIRSDFVAGKLTPRHVDALSAAVLIEKGDRDDVYPIVALDDAQALIGGKRGRFTPRTGFEDHPVTETTWAGALAYCLWRGGRLPSEVEWEAAARGTDGRPYPWGDAPPTSQRVFVSRQTGITSPVGLRPAGASPFGVLDMSGSMAEWTSSLKRPYPYVASDGREALSAPGERVTRGGDYVFDTGPQVLTATHRNGFSNRPSRGHRHIGFRCAANAPTSAS